MTLMAARPVLEELRSAAYRLHALAAGGTRSAGCWSARARTARRRCGSRSGCRCWRRSRRTVEPPKHWRREVRRRRCAGRLLIRSARVLAEELAGRLGPQVPEAAPRPLPDNAPGATAGVEVG